MKNILNVRKNFRISTISILELLLIAFGVVNTFLYFSHFQKIFGNSSSRILLALGPTLGIGKPYADLWEFVPPGFLVVATAWIKIFGWGILSFKVFQIVVLTVIGVTFLLILNKVSASKLLGIPYLISFVIIFYSPYIQTDLLSIEYFGTVFALLGLMSLIFIKDYYQKIFWAAFLISMASQMKETTTFTILAITPYFLYGAFSKNLKLPLYKLFLAGAAGLLTTASIVIFYLLVNGSLQAYSGILSYKFGRTVPLGNIGTVLVKFNFLENYFAEKYLHFHNYLKNSVLILALFLLRNIPLKIKFIKYTQKSYGIRVNFTRIIIPDMESISILLFAAGIFLGTTIYNQYSLDARMMPVITAFFLAAAVLTKHILININSLLKPKKYRTLVKTALFVFLLISFSPQTEIIKNFPKQTIFHFNGQIIGEKEYQSRYIQTSNLDLNNYIRSITAADDCILNPYGWEVAETYIYSGRRPCTKYFLLNIIISDNKMLSEYKNQILQKPPKVIVYNTELTDLNLENVSKNIIDYPNMLNNCYTRDNNFINYPYLISGANTHVTLYFKKQNITPEDMKMCVSKYIKN